MINISYIYQNRLIKMRKKLFNSNKIMIFNQESSGKDFFPFESVNCLIY